MTRIHRPILLTSAALAAAVALAGPAAASDVAEVETSTKDGKTVLAVLATYVDDFFIPKGGEPGEWPEEEDFLPSVGDGISWEDELSQDGTAVGTQRGLCTVTKVVRSEITNDCTATLTFDNGTLKLAVKLVFDAAAEDEGEDEGDTVDIVGGTGAYAGATGAAVVKTLNDDSESITATFSLGSGQVSHVPVGGAAAGGLHSGGNGADMALIGLGVVGALGGTALVARGRNRPVR